MRRWLAASVLATVLAPAPAAADLGFVLSLPGFGLFVGGPPPVAYVPPPPLVYAPPPLVYAPPPVLYVPPPRPFHARALYGRPFHGRPAVVVTGHPGWHGKPGRKVGWAKRYRH